jgi:DNA-binding HxlR family transcriptional regulator
MLKMTRKKAVPKRRSGCPLNASVEMLGDRWSLLIVRDMMLQGARTYKTFLECYEGIATNILADRLRKLQAYGIITPEPDPSDRRKVVYLLTRKGIDLAPVLTEMVLWAAAHEETDNQALVRQMRADKEKFLTGVRRRWADALKPRSKNPSADTTPARLAHPASGKARSERSRNRH